MFDPGGAKQPPWSRNEAWHEWPRFKDSVSHERFNFQRNRFWTSNFASAAHVIKCLCINNKETETACHLSLWSSKQACHFLTLSAKARKSQRPPEEKARREERKRFHMYVIWRNWESGKWQSATQQSLFDRIKTNVKSSLLTNKETWNTWRACRTLKLLQRAERCPSPNQARGRKQNKWGVFSM